MRVCAQRSQLMLAENGTLASIRFVPSAFNPSDGLTRDETIDAAKAFLAGTAITPEESSSSEIINRIIGFDESHESQELM